MTQNDLPAHSATRSARTAIVAAGFVGAFCLGMSVTSDGLTRDIAMLVFSGALLLVGITVTQRGRNSKLGGTEESFITLGRTLIALALIGIGVRIISMLVGT